MQDRIQNALLMGALIAATMLEAMTLTAQASNPYVVQAHYIHTTDGELKNTTAVAALLEAQKIFQTSLETHLKPHEKGHRDTFILENLKYIDSDNDSEWFESASSYDILRELSYDDRTEYQRVLVIFVDGAESLRGANCGHAYTNWDNHKGWQKTQPYMGGAVFIPMELECDDLASVIAHGLGTTFGLNNNLDETTTMHRFKGNGLAQRRFTRWECRWLAKTRFFNDTYEDDIRDFSGAQLVTHELTPNKQKVKFNIRLTTHVGNLFIQLSRSTENGLETLQWKAVKRWQQEQAIYVPVELLEGYTGIAIDILNFEGVFSTQSFVYALPDLPAVPKGAPFILTGVGASTWARIKMAD